MTKYEQLITGCLLCILARLATLDVVSSTVGEEQSSWTKFSHWAYSLYGEEFCDPPFLRLEEGISNLTDRLNAEFFGQHIALQTTLISIKAHLRDENPRKALVLSFHGWAGSGKTYLVELIANSLYKYGVNSKFVKMYTAAKDFADPTRAAQYARKVHKEINSTITSCQYSMFVFDEVDKTPPGVFDTVIPFINHPQKFTGTNHKKSIFIFITNTGALNITSVTFDAWKNQRKREDLNLKDYEDVLSAEVFNKPESGMYHSGLIDKMLVDYFIPFLPLERSHVIKCAMLEGRRHSELFNISDAREVARTLSYWPTNLELYSKTGCRKVDGAVKYLLMIREVNEKRMLANNTLDDDGDLDGWETGSYDGEMKNSTQGDVDNPSDWDNNKEL